MNYLVKVKIEGKNVSNYLKYLIKNKINIFSLKVIKHNELDILIAYKDYDLLTKYSKTYKVTIIKKYGKLRLLSFIKNNIIILSSLIFSIIFLYLLSHVIFSVDVMSNDKEMVNLIMEELTKYDIKKYRFKKDYNYLVQVKKKILKDNNNSLEWIEIEESGTKYIIRLVERKKENIKDGYLYQSIVASKDATITSIKSSSGEKIKSVNEYVKKGDTIISGELLKPDGNMIYTKAIGSVLGEVWYQVEIDYPLYYKEERVTGKNKNILSLYFFNKKKYLFPYKKYKQFKYTSKTIFENSIIPIKLAKEKLYEVIIKEEIYTPEEALEQAIQYTISKMKDKNKRIVKIKDTQVLTKINQNSKISLTIFVVTIEDITEIKEIMPELEEIIP